MKKTLLTLLLTAGVAGYASAATLVNYVASADPNLSPDAVGGANVWTCAFMNGSGSYFGAPGGISPNMWAIYAYQPAASSAIMTYAFEGSALAAGQSVSLTYAMNTSVSAGTNVGIQLLDASSNVQTQFIFTGGTPLGWAYSDTGTGLANFAATGKAYDVNDPFKVTFTLTSSTTYSATASAGTVATQAGDATTGAWSGTYANPITQIRVVNLGAGDASDQYSNNLIVATVPEPTSFAVLAGGGLLGSVLLRRRRAC